MIDAGRASLRFIARHLISIVLLFGFIAALFDNRRRAFHDRLADSIVTTRPRSVWSVDDTDGS